MSEIIETDSPDAADIAVIADGLRAYNTAMAGYDDYRPLAVFVTDPATGKVIGGLYGASSRGQLRVDRFFLPQELRRDRLGSRLLKMAEEEGRRRRCTRVTLNTMEIQAPGFYLKQGYEMAAKLDCDPPGVTRYVMNKTTPSLSMSIRDAEAVTDGAVRASRRVVCGPTISTVRSSCCVCASISGSS